MATYTIKAIDLQVGQYLVAIPASTDNSAVSYSAPYPEVTAISYGNFADGQLGVNYAINGGVINYNMLNSDVITVSTSSIDDGKNLVSSPSERLRIGDGIGTSTVSSLNIVANMADSTTHTYSLDDIVQVTR